MVSVVLPGSGAVATRMFSAVRDEWNRNRSVALRAAERVSGMSREDLAERIELHPELVPLVTRLLWEAAMTGQGSLLEAMGAAFGKAAGDIARSSDYELVLGGLRNLRGEDIGVLRHLRDRTVFHQRADDDPRTEETSAFQTVHGLGGRLSLSEESLTFACVRLVSQGFATSASVLGGQRYEISLLGLLLCDALEQLPSGE